ncbi:ComEC family protein [Phytobacter sp. RSE-02]|uniref:ComEC family protein n=1 Tax=Phytobacter sp. RSE-02 TaxID=3229229 RepID=UPI00339D403C
MPLPALALCVNLGILPLLFLPTLPEIEHVWMIAVTGLLLASRHQRYIRYAGFTVLFFAWGLLAALQVLWPTQHLPGANRLVRVVITGTDHATTHYADITHLDGKRVIPAAGITLYGEYLPQPVCVGQQWDMTIRARPVHGQLNDGGFDTQRHALSSHLPLTGRFVKANIVNGKCSWRGRYLDSLSTHLEAYPWRQVIMALGLGERAALDSDVKDIMRQTGTAHLMAISGLHIALTAMMGVLLTRGVQRFFPARRINWHLPLLIGVVCAICYAGLTGMQPPAFRTSLSIGIWAALRLSGRLWTPWQVWVCCIAGILFIDPIAVLSQSLWLSAFAVAALIFWYQWLPLRIHNLCWWRRILIDLLYIQAGMTLLLMPLQVLSFHGLSLSSMVANLIAVPLVTFVTVPLVLFGMLLHLIGPQSIESCVWYLADGSLAILFWFLQSLPLGWIHVDVRWLGLAWLPWFFLIMGKLRCWRTFPAASCTAILLLLFPFWQTHRDGDWAVHMLDVGQGLAMVIERNGKAILYDTGLAWPGGDSAQQLITPWLRWHHLQPEGIILSHEHLDHRGGLNTLLADWPSLWVKSPLGWAGHQPCFRGERWQWQGLTFTAHWPLNGVQMKGNNRSCVVKVDDGQQSILLTGDIESAGEMAMMSHYWQHLQATLIQVPHHGSNTSSTLPFIQRVNGKVALASASRYNNWRLPSVKVQKRYRQQAYQWFDTPHHGQITVLFSRQGWKILSLREQIFPRWYHQWFGVPGDNG